MAACAATSRIATGVPSLSAGSKKVVSRAVVQASCFAGLRSSSRVDGLKSSRLQSFSSRTAVARSVAKTTCSLDTPLVISLSTGALLFLGRFVFLPFQRDTVARQGLPEQNGQTHYEAGDDRAQEVVSLLNTNDPAGFTIVDVLAWGALGHAIAFFILATGTSGYDPTF
jgi:photosystem I subunit V